MSAPYREPTDVSDLAEPACCYPVIVTDTRVHVVWVQAEDQDAAVESARYDTYELLNDNETCASADLNVRKPGDDFHSWDWETIYGGDYYGSYQGRKFDAHVEARDHYLLMQRYEAEHAACVAAGHPRIEVRTYWDGSTQWYCPTIRCGYFDTDPSAVGGEPKATTEKASDLGGGS